MPSRRSSIYQRRVISTQQTALATPRLWYKKKLGNCKRTLPTGILSMRRVRRVTQPRQPKVKTRESEPNPPSSFRMLRRPFRAFDSNIIFADPPSRRYFAAAARSVHPTGTSTRCLPIFAFFVAAAGSGDSDGGHLWW